jgi:hypothetical protein
MNVSALVASAVCEHCGETNDLALEWEKLAAEEAPGEALSPLEVTVRPQSSARCHVCSGALGESQLEGMTAEHAFPPFFPCACGASIRMRRVPDPLARLCHLPREGLLVGEDEDRLAARVVRGRARPRRRFYLYLSTEESARVANERRQERVKRFSREHVPGRIQAAAEARSRSDTLALFLISAVLVSADALAIHFYEASLGAATLRAVSVCVLAAMTLGVVVLRIRSWRYRARMMASVVVLAQRKDDRFVFFLDGERRTLPVHRANLPKRARPPRAAFVAIARDDPSVAFFAHADDGDVE